MREIESWGIKREERKDKNELKKRRQKEEKGREKGEFRE